MPGRWVERAPRPRRPRHLCRRSGRRQTAKSRSNACLLRTRRGSRTGRHGPVGGNCRRRYRPPPAVEKAVAEPPAILRRLFVTIKKLKRRAMPPNAKSRSCDGRRRNARGVSQHPDTAPAAGDGPAAGRVGSHNALKYRDIPLAATDWKPAGRVNLGSAWPARQFITLSYQSSAGSAAPWPRRPSPGAGPGR